MSVITGSICPLLWQRDVELQQQQTVITGIASTTFDQIYYLGTEMAHLCRCAVKPY